MITTSEIKISVLLSRQEALKALRAVHQVFELEKPPKKLDQTPIEDDAAHSDAADVVARLQGVDMEELTIDEITLDSSQSRVTISGVPDSPGVAAQIFREVAEAGIFVDMIVQSYKGYQGQTSLSFTVPTEHLDQSLQVAKQLASKFQCRDVSSSPQVAKLSVSGIGLRSHTSVGIRMFRALAEAGINVAMVNTSEVRVNMVVEGEHGHLGLQKLQESFADVIR